MTTFNLAIAQELFTSKEQFPVDFDDAWKWLGYSTKGNAKRKFENAGFIEGVEFQTFIRNDKREIGATQTEVILLSIDCIKHFCMLANTENGKQVRKYFIEAEKELKKLQRETPRSFSEALFLAAKIQQEKELMALEIASLEEANERQAEIIDELFDYSSIIRIAKYNNCSEKNFSWHRLKAASQALGKEIKTAPCPRFGKKNLYSHEAWRLAYPAFRLPETTTLVVQNKAS